MPVSTACGGRAVLRTVACVPLALPRLRPRRVGRPLTHSWILRSAGLRGLVGLSRPPVVGIRPGGLARTAAAQGQPLRPADERLFRIWFACGWPAIAAMPAILRLMANSGGQPLRPV
ncbi:DUF2269 family protein [Methylobacterium isbiliense]|uniref:DUF2269 family protein n=1 Tax=Methylobacterium isbiliense TaxID=315478 RepID=UPI00338E41CD